MDVEIAHLYAYQSGKRTAQVRLLLSELGRVEKFLESYINIQEDAEGWMLLESIRSMKNHIGDVEDEDPQLHNLSLENTKLREVIEELAYEGGVTCQKCGVQRDAQHHDSCLMTKLSSARK